MQSFLRTAFGARLCLTSLLLPLALAPGCRRDAPKVANAATVAAPGLLQFVDRARQAGLNYRWTIPGPRPLSILQTIGNGCAFLDYDNSGDLSILLVGTDHVALFKGDGRGHFADVSHAVGLDRLRGHFLGCAVGDYDNDGFDDIYLSGYRTGLLLHNEKGQRFTDMTRQAGLRPQPWGTSCAFIETVPGSVRLDLFVDNYAHFGPQPSIPQLCLSAGVQTSCGPRYYKPIKPVFYRNLGRGRFIADDQALGLSTTSGRALGVAAAPLDRSGRLTVAISNDELSGDLLSPGGRSGALYTNVAAPAGTAFDRDGNIHGGMGTDWGDYDNDGKFDLFVATFQNEAKSLYHNDDGGVFSDASYQTRLVTPTLPNVAFGCKFFDADNDGWLDLAIANGHVQDNIHVIDSSTQYRQTTQLFHNSGTTPITFTDVSQTAGAAFQQPIVGRGLAVGDYDNDGRVDLLVVDSEGAPLLLHNESAGAGHWLSLTLTGVHGNRDGYGAVVTARAGGRTLMRLCQADGSYLSSSDRRVFVGLGASARAETLSITWPGGHTDTWKNFAADRSYALTEGDPNKH